MNWTAAREQSLLAGGDLATISNAAENAMVHSIGGTTYCFLGGFQAPGSCEPACGWQWVDGGNWTYTNWAPAEPNDQGGERYLEMYATGGWNDVQRAQIRPFIIEWSADCNNDGIVDYGQVLDGTFADANSNSELDVCETLLVPEEYATIQAAVDVAVNGNTVLVGPGTYAPFDIAGKSIAIRSTQGAAATIIDGSGQGRSTVVFGIGTTLRTTLAGFTVRCGMGTGAYWYAKGGGCYIEHGNATFEDCDFTGGVYGCGYGGGILGSGGSFIVRRCRFLGTSAIHDAGGLHLTAGFVELSEQIPNEPAGVRVLVEDCTVTNCYGYNAGGMAIGLVDATEQQHEEVVLRRTMFAGNVGEYGPSSLFPSDLRLAAGAAVGLSSHLFRVTNCVFGSGSLVFAMCGYWGEGYPLNTLVSDCVFPTGSLRRNCGELSIASSFFCNGTIPVTGAWTDLGGNETTCPSDDDCDSDGMNDFHQIVLGLADDLDGNWVIDECESLRVPGQYATIQAAIDAVGPRTSRVVQVAAGTYNETFALNGKDVTVRGAPRDATILDGVGLARSIATFSGGEPNTASLENLVFRNGSAGSRMYPKAPFTVGGAVYGHNSAASIRNCVFQSCTADFGGAIYLIFSQVLVDSCSFESNLALQEGGGLMIYETTGAVRACAFIANRCGFAGPGSGSAFKSAGAFAMDDVIVFEDCTVTGAVGNNFGSALEHYQNNTSVRGVLRIVGSNISGNVAGDGASGLRVLGDMDSCILAEGTSICGNEPTNVEGPYLIEGSVTVCDCHGDLTGDGVVNAADLGVLLSSWGLTGPSGVGDTNHDGLVNAADVSILLSGWGACPN